jgi:3-dehydroshikimate dehydratase
MSTLISRRHFVATSLAVPFVFRSAGATAAPGGAMKLAGFADEISPDIDEQIRVCKKLGIGFFELRGAAGKNVLDFDVPLRTAIKTKLRDNGLGVASIGSPIGKVKISDPWEAHFDRFKVAVELAEFFGAPFIRIFSYYPAPGRPIAQDRDEVMRRMSAKAEYAKGHPVTLVHENEAEIFGEHGPACLDLVKTVNSPKLRCVFDPANFIQAGDDVLKNWEMLKPYVVHFHIKDCERATKKVVPAGQGDGHILELLQDAKKSGYAGFLSLEPHLRVAGRSGGESGPELFEVATTALRGLCAKAGIQLQ